MARPLKQGLEYFPFDTDFFSDVKVRRIAIACGPASTSILICLLCNIYRDKGYYILWDEDLPFVVADSIGTTEGAVIEVIKKAVQVGFFDSEKFEKFKILTSNGIQRRFSSAVKRREEIEYVEEYIVSACNNSVSARNNSVSAYNNEQSKVKERKVKRKKKRTPYGVSSSGRTQPPNPNMVDFDAFMDYFNKSMAKCQIPCINLMTERRKTYVTARCKEYGKQALQIAIEKAAASDFLNGSSNKAFVASFDWIFRPNNFPKVLEGNYDNNRQTSTIHGANNTGSTPESRGREIVELIARLESEDQGK